ncbi:DUF7097 family protein [Haloarcula salinisoli]|uniref:Uncharacterized protein n=1 Tax=Haloarcula salinisoli TaxID=2487746 RepID=A0A8J8C7M9_9EURY|nr:hypothetical protein [Halomicroarcula salinisoli]MBX0302264.1 hypothetical protein [Halomicroarcula salinisoli]
MEKAPGGTSVGVSDPYDYVDRCDFVTDEGKCRWAREHGHHDPEFANARSAENFRCPAAVGPDDEPRETPRVSEQESGEQCDPRADEVEWDWSDCPHFRCRNRDRECIRCGLEERRNAFDDSRPLLEEHHLSYGESASEDELSHEITVFLCRWCHAKVHNSWARIDDDAAPDPEAIAEQEGRKSQEHSEMGFESAADRYDSDDE